jgi:hypothetical protein
MPFTTPPPTSFSSSTTLFVLKSALSAWTDSGRVYNVHIVYIFEYSVCTVYTLCMQAACEFCASFWSAIAVLLRQAPVDTVAIPVWKHVAAFSCLWLCSCAVWTGTSGRDNCKSPFARNLRLWSNGQSQLQLRSVWSCVLFTRGPTRHEMFKIFARYSKKMFKTLTPSPLHPIPPFYKVVSNSWSLRRSNVGLTEKRKENPFYSSHATHKTSLATIHKSSLTLHVFKTRHTHTTKWQNCLVSADTVQLNWNMKNVAILSADTVRSVCTQVSRPSRFSLVFKKLQ